MANKPISNQIDKVLALADSNHDAEAILAVRKAREMLARDGLTFSDLARAAVQKAQPQRINLPFGLLSGQHIVTLETEILELRKEIEDLRADRHAFEAQITHWKSRAVELEKQLGSSQTDAVKWRQLARDTVDKLKDLGQSIMQDEPADEAQDPAKSA